MGGAQPLAVTMNGGVALVVEVDPSRIERRLATRYVDERTDDLDEALDRVERWIGRRDRAFDRPRRERRRRPARNWCARGVVPDVVTDQTSAHDALNGYVPNGMSLREAESLRRVNPKAIHRTGYRRDGRARPRDAQVPA